RIGELRQSRFSRARPTGTGSAVARLENLAAAIHAGLEIDVVRTAKLAAVLVFDISRRLERVRRTAEATLARRRLPLGHCHGSTPSQRLAGRGRETSRRPREIGSSGSMIGRVYTQSARPWLEHFGKSVSVSLREEAK